jgi:hypothetical protein
MDIVMYILSTDPMYFMYHDDAVENNIKYHICICKIRKSKEDRHNGIKKMNQQRSTKHYTEKLKIEQNEPH